MLKPSILALLVSSTALAEPARRIELAPGGYLHVDARRTLTEDELHDMTIRRLRFRLDGSAGPSFRFRTLLDFAGSKLTLLDAWGEVVLAPELQLRAGKDKSQFGIERLQSATQMVFVERAFPSSLAPNRDIGVWVRGDLAGRKVHYAIGIVDGVADNAVLEGETDGVLEYNAHVLISPFASHPALGDLAVGGATTFGPTHGSLTAPGLTSIRSAAQATIVKYTTGADSAATAVADGYRTRLAAHGYYYRGPAGVLVEYVRDHEPVSLLGVHTSVDDHAWQVAGSLALTPGDHPSYKGIRPVHPFDPSKSHYGAVELGVRFSRLSIDDASAEAGITSAASSAQTAREFTLGANWYLSEVVKLQLDYALTQLTPFAGGAERPSEHVLATRLQAAI